MSKYLKLFDTHSQYESYTADTETFIKPNVSFCLDTPNEVNYNPYVEPAETRVVAKFNVTDTSNPTKISYKNQYYDGTSGFSVIEIDGVEMSPRSGYTFSTTGEHIVKYTLKDPTMITYAAFEDCHNITSIIIPDSVTSIDEHVFNNCRSLTSITLSNNLTSIGRGAFYNCRSLTSIVIPDGVTGIIGRETFAGCSGLTSIVIPDGVTSINDGAFKGCSGLTSVTIGSGVTTIDYYVFQDCTSITNITSKATTAPTIKSYTFQNVKRGGTLYVPIGSSGYNAWLGYLSGWTKVEQ